MFKTKINNPNPKQVTMMKKLKWKQLIKLNKAVACYLLQWPNYKIVTQSWHKFLIQITFYLSWSQVLNQWVNLKVLFLLNSNPQSHLYHNLNLCSNLNKAWEFQGIIIIKLCILHSNQIKWRDNLVFPISIVSFWNHNWIWINFNWVMTC